MIFTVDCYHKEIRFSGNGLWSNDGLISICGCRTHDDLAQLSNTRISIIVQVYRCLSLYVSQFHLYPFAGDISPPDSNGNSTQTMRECQVHLLACCSRGVLFLGQVDVAGLTIAEARDTIEKGLAPYVKHPVVGVTVKEVTQ